VWKTWKLAQSSSDYEEVNKPLSDVRAWPRQLITDLTKGSRSLA
jgi:hypothetical protein